MRKLLVASMAFIAAPAMAFNFGMSDQGTSFGPNNWGNGNNGWNNGPSFGWGNNRSWGNGPQHNWNGSTPSMQWGSHQAPSAPAQQPQVAAPRDPRGINIDRDQTMKFDRSTFSWGNGWSPRTGSGWGPSWGNGPSVNMMPGWNNNYYPPHYYYPLVPQKQAPTPDAK